MRSKREITNYANEAIKSEATLSITNAVVINTKLLSDAMGVKCDAIDANMILNVISDSNDVDDINFVCLDIIDIAT